MNDIKISSGPYKGLKVTTTSIVPSPGDLKLRCNCGGMEFRMHIKPVAAQARVTALICTTCAKIRNIDPNGFIEGTGEKTSTKEALEFLGKEKINE